MLKKQSSSTYIFLERDLVNCEVIIVSDSLMLLWASQIIYEVFHLILGLFFQKDWPIIRYSEEYDRIREACENQITLGTTTELWIFCVKRRLGEEAPPWSSINNDIVELDLFSMVPKDHKVVERYSSMYRIKLYPLDLLKMRMFFFVRVHETGIKWLEWTKSHSSMLLKRGLLKEKNNETLPEFNCRQCGQAS